MDHGHGGHGGGDMDMPTCSMNMLWNHQVADTCVVFRSWHISTWSGMLFSCMAIVGISVGYAALLAHSRQYERALAQQLADAPRPAAGYAAVEDLQGKVGVTPVPRTARIRRAGLYAATVGISYFLMLVAMTYNTYLCSAIVIGAFAGHYVYEADMDVGSAIAASPVRGLACH